MSEHEWVEFSVEIPGNGNASGFGFQALDEVSHVAHIHIAEQIVRENRIRAGLIYDKSKLNKQRILVTWLSPNRWTHGFRYGNVRFTFPWKSLIADRNYYWVEKMDYSPKAARILITDKDYTGTLTPYDPALGNGPWYYDREADTHYWNGNFCLELMLEEDLDLSACANIDFVAHNPNQCCIDPKSCPDRGVRSARAAGRFLAGVIASSFDTLLLRERVSRNGAETCRFDVESAAGHLGEFILMYAGDPAGSIAYDNPAAAPLIRQLLTSAASNNIFELKSLADLFSSRNDIIRITSDLIRSEFDIPAETPTGIEDWIDDEENGFRLEHEAQRTGTNFEIDADMIAEALFSYITDNIPGDLESLSSNTRIDDVYGISLDEVSITKEGMQVSGSAVVGLDLWFGGSRDGMEGSDVIDFRFDVLLNLGLDVEEVYLLKFDISNH